MVLYKFYVFYSDMKFKMAATAGLSLTLHFEFHIGTKNVKFVEDHPMNIHVQFAGVSKWAGTRYVYPPEIVYSTGRNY
jgi:hypothetical protein